MQCLLLAAMINTHLYIIEKYSVQNIAAWLLWLAAHQ